MSWRALIPHSLLCLKETYTLCLRRTDLRVSTGRLRRALLEKGPTNLFKRSPDLWLNESLMNTYCELTNIMGNFGDKRCTNLCIVPRTREVNTSEYDFTCWCEAEYIVYHCVMMVSIVIRCLTDRIRSALHRKGNPLVIPLTSTTFGSLRCTNSARCCFCWIDSGHWILALGWFLSPRDNEWSWLLMISLQCTQKWYRVQIQTLMIQDWKE